MPGVPVHCRLPEEGAADYSPLWCLFLFNFLDFNSAFRYQSCQRADGCQHRGHHYPQGSCRSADSQRDFHDYPTSLYNPYPADVAFVDQLFYLSQQFLALETEKWRRIATETGVKVETDDGSVLEARYLIGADGANSVVARQLGLRQGRTLLGAI